MDIPGKIASSRNVLEQLVSAIPGYQGYKERELRREADKLLRMHLAQQFQEQRSRLSEVQASLANAGRVGPLTALEKAMMKLQLLMDSLRTATYGATGWFDAVKIKEKELDALYAFDAALADGVALIRGILDRLVAAKDDGEVLSIGNELVTALEQLNTTFNQRRDVILKS